MWDSMDGPLVIFCYMGRQWVSGGPHLMESHQCSRGGVKVEYTHSLYVMHWLKTHVAHKWITGGKKTDGWPLVTHRWTTDESGWWPAKMAVDGPPVGRNFIVIWV